MRNLPLFCDNIITMTAHQAGTGKKFLYNETKKSKDGQEDERQFHSKGYHPTTEKSLIDVEKVWSVKDLILDGGYKPRGSDLGGNTNSGYYSRHIKYKNTKDAPAHTNEQPNLSKWNNKAESKNPQQQNKNNSWDHLDF